MQASMHTFPYTLNSAFVNFETHSANVICVCPKTENDNQISKTKSHHLTDENMWLPSNSDSGDLASQAM